MDPPTFSKPGTLLASTYGYAHPFFSKPEYAPGQNLFIIETNDKRIGFSTIVLNYGINGMRAVPQAIAPLLTQD